MANSDPVSQAHQVFELAGIFVELLHQSEVDWCADSYFYDHDFDLKRFELAIERVRSLVSKIRLQVKSQTTITELTRFGTALRVFYRDFCNEWASPSRAQILDSIRSGDPEFEWSQTRFLLTKSPLLDGKWQVLRATAMGAVNTLDLNLQLCFKLSVLLSSEIYPTMTGAVERRGARLRRADRELIFHSLRFPKQVSKAIDATAEHFPGLANIQYTGGRPDVAEREIDRLRTTIGKRLKKPMSAPGYLGLVLDRAAERVGRCGQWHPLKRKLLWNLLVRLEGGRDEIRARESFHSAWGVDGIPTEAAFDRAVSDLKTAIRPLGVTIRVQRGIGLTLVVDASPRRPKRRHKS